MQDHDSQASKLTDAFSWRLLLPIVEKPRVLSIMTPDSEYLAALGSIFDNVTSCESGPPPVTDEEVATFAGQGSIRQVRGNVLSLPFRDKSFDLVVASLVSDTRNDGSEQLHWQTRHEEILGSLHRVLAAQGCICLCTPNRWDYRKLAEWNNSAAKESSGKEPGGLAANWENVIQNYRRLSNHFLSPKRYISVLRDAGFSAVQAYVAFPDCRTPRFLVPFDQGAYRYYRRHFTYPHGGGLRELLGRVIARMGIDRFLESHLLITGTKS